MSLTLSLSDIQFIETQCRFKYCILNIIAYNIYGVSINSWWRIHYTRIDSLLHRYSNGSHLKMWQNAQKTSGNSLLFLLLFLMVESQNMPNRPWSPLRKCSVSRQTFACKCLIFFLSGFAVVAVRTSIVCAVWSFQLPWQRAVRFQHWRDTIENWKITSNNGQSIVKRCFDDLQKKKKEKQ